MDAFEGLAPVHEGYASLPVADAFDWGDAATALPVGHEWYMVAFRSVRRPDADEARLCDYDERAHQEAAGVPGFVHYYRGPTASDGSCVSFCLWDSRAEARAASALPAHKEAISIIGEMYEAYALEFLRVRRLDASLALAFEPYDASPTVVHGAVLTPAPDAVPDPVIAPVPDLVPDQLPDLAPGYGPGSLPGLVAS